MPGNSRSEKATRSSAWTGATSSVITSLIGAFAGLLALSYSLLNAGGGLKVLSFTWAAVFFAAGLYAMYMAKSLSTKGTPTDEGKDDMPASTTDEEGSSDA